jgi:uncharacterized protein (DUF1697 family)
MNPYIVFLRGVNMAGHNSLKMNDLSGLFVSLGFNDVRTYIQSGNVIFSDQSGKSNTELAAIIEMAILKKFNFTIPAMIRNIDDLKNILRNNPFSNEENFNPGRMSAILLHKETTQNQVDMVRNVDYPPDKFKVLGREIFVYCPNGFGKTKLYTNFFEKKMGVTGTARNWNTINAILQMAEYHLQKD